MYIITQPQSNNLVHPKQHDTSITIKTIKL